MEYLFNFFLCFDIILLSTGISVRWFKLNKFDFNPGDYIYLNTSKVSIMDWHPFTIVEKVNDNELTLQIKVNNKWTKKLHKKMLETYKVKKEFNQEFNWSFKVDGPYGGRINDSLNSENLIMVGAGHGISKFAPIERKSFSI